MNNSTANDAREFYCFVSYKHRDVNQFVKDEEWAEAIAFHLTQLHIPSQTKPPIRDEAYINLNPKDDVVYPIFRDYEVLNAGSRFSERIISALRHSRMLVVIITDEMLKDQEGKVKRHLPVKDEKRYEDAWCFREIFHFLNNHSPDDIILVYIGSRKIQDIIPSVLTEGVRKRDIDNNKVPAKKKIEYEECLKVWTGKNIVLVNPSEGKEVIKETQLSVAAKIAASIFKTDADQFRNYYSEAKARRKAEKRLWVLVTSILLLLFASGVVASFMFKRISDARNYLIEAQKSLDSGNRLEGGRLAQNAYRSWPWINGAAEVMWDAKDSTYAVLGVKSAITFDQADSLLAYVDKNRYVVIVDTHSFQEIRRIDAGKAYRAHFSPDGSRLLVFLEKGFFDSICRVYDLKTEEWHESIFSFRNNGVAPLYSKESSFLCTGEGLSASDGRWFYVYDDNGHLLHPSKASFMGTDSIYVAITHSEKAIKALLYNFVDTDMNSNYSNVYGPSEVFNFPEGTEDAIIIPYSNVIVSYSRSSICTWVIEYKDRCYSIIEEHRESIDNPIEIISYCGSPHSLLVEDSVGNAYSYLLSTGYSHRLHRNYSVSRLGEEEARLAVPVGISPLSMYGILYYIPGRGSNRITDLSYLNYRLPDSVRGTRVRCSLHGSFICVSIENQSGELIESYLFSNGDGRFITPNGIPEVVSSSYFIEYRCDYLRERTSESTSTIYSGPCLINAQTGEHIMHLSRLDDIMPNDVRYMKAYLNDNNLATVFGLKDNKKCIRFYDIAKRTFLKEQILESNAQCFGWMKDGFFLYENRDTLYRDLADSKYQPDILCSNYAYVYSANNAYVFPFQTKDTNRYWYSAIDGQIRTLEHDWGLSPYGDYYVYNDLRSNPLHLDIIDARSLDTLFTRQINGWAGIETFDRSSRKFFYSEDRMHICCMGIPSGKENWILDIWAPVSIVAGNKYVVLQSTSLFVVDISNGKIICEFETNPVTKLRLLLSPDEEWLLAGDKLYSLKEKELIASDLADDYVSLENDYIVYPKRIMMLPNKSLMFK